MKNKTPEQIRQSAINILNRVFGPKGTVAKLQATTKPNKSAKMTKKTDPGVS